jgi:hypothetical protein
MPPSVKQRLSIPCPHATSSNVLFRDRNITVRRDFSPFSVEMPEPRFLSNAGNVILFHRTGTMSLVRHRSTRVGQNWDRHFVRHALPALFALGISVDSTNGDSTAYINRRQFREAQVLRYLALNGLCSCMILLFFWQ